MANKDKFWMAKAFSKHPGALHRQMGVPAGQKIPLTALQRAAKVKGKKGARARLALRGRKVDRLTPGDTYDVKAGS